MGEQERSLQVQVDPTKLNTAAAEDPLRAAGDGDATDAGLSPAEATCCCSLVSVSTDWSRAIQARRSSPGARRCGRSRLCVFLCGGWRCVHCGSHCPVPTHSDRQLPPPHPFTAGADVLSACSQRWRAELLFSAYVICCSYVLSLLDTHLYPLR